MVSATAVERYVITMRPMKLQMAPMAMAASELMERAPIAVEIALDASVAPLTKTVPMTRTVMTRSTGFETNAPMKTPKLIMSYHPCLAYLVCGRGPPHQEERTHILMLCGISHAMAASM